MPKYYHVDENGKERDVVEAYRLYYAGSKVQLTGLKWLPFVEEPPWLEEYKAKVEQCPLIKSGLQEDLAKEALTRSRKEERKEQKIEKKKTPTRRRKSRIEEEEEEEEELDDEEEEEEEEVEEKPKIKKKKQTKEKDSKSKKSKRKTRDSESEWSG